MSSDNFDEIAGFLAVARERSFTKAAARLGVTPSALSHSIKRLEARLKVRLLSRTTRDVSATAAGERLVQSVGPHIEAIRAELSGLSDLSGKPTGTIRVVCTDYVVGTIFRPMLGKFLRDYPDITVEIGVDNGLTNIVEQRFDAGVRLGEAVSKDMIAVRIGPDWRFSVVGSPAYFDRRSPPQTPQELTNHACINMRLPSAGGLYAWEFEKDGRKLNARVDGPLTFNSVFPILDAALDGHGLAYLPQDVVEHHVAEGHLQEVLADWCPTFEGYHLYYPNRRQPSPAFSLFVEALRRQAMLS